MSTVFSEIFEDFGQKGDFRGRRRLRTGEVGSIIAVSGKVRLDGGGVGGDETETSVDVGVGDLEGAGEGGVVGLGVKEGVEALSFLGSANEGGGVAGVVLNGFVAGETLNVTPVRDEPI